MNDRTVNPGVPGTPQKRQRAFGPDARLRGCSQLAEVKASRQSAAGRLCLVKVLKTPPDGQRRAAFLISRRFDKLAVVRNRARRLFREVFRLLYGNLPPVWMVFIPRRPIKEAAMQDVLAEVTASLRRLRVLPADRAGGEGMPEPVPMDLSAGEAPGGV